MAMTDEDRDDLRARMSDSDFWYDPFTIPQYDRLVEDGAVSLEEADTHRRGREEMGLAMTFDALPPRPHKKFEWLYAAGGPAVPTADYYAAFEHVGLEWRVDAIGDFGTLNHSVSSGDEAYHVLKVSKSHSTREGEAVRWEVQKKIADGIYARMSGFEGDAPAAFATVMAASMAPEHFLGLDWFPHFHGVSGTGVIAVYEGEELTLAKWNTGAEWRWSLSLADGSVTRRMAAMFGNYQLSGEAESREGAAQAGMAAKNQLMLLCAELIGDDSFEAGRQAGRSELRAQIAALP